MKGRLLTALLCIAAALCLTFGLSACENAGKGADGHTHIAEHFQVDENGHWKICTVCGNKFAVGDHSYHSGNTCETCGYSAVYTTGLKYTLDKDADTYTLTGPGEARDAAELMISAYYNGKAVTSIGDYAFVNCNGLTSLTIPGSVTSVGSCAFAYCSGLESVIWNAENCTTAGSLDYPLFKDCANLKTVTFGANVKTIPAYAFYECSGLAGIEIPDSVTSIGSGAFYGCNGLANVAIGSGVVSIGDQAFRGCSGLTSLTIPNGVTSVLERAFYECSGLTEITIPEGAISIGSEAFAGTAYYNDAAKWDASGVLYIGNHLIQAKDTISGVYTIRTGTQTIAGEAFFKRSGLTGITIPDSVTLIGENAFRYCSGLTSLTIPEKVTTIEYGAFCSCSGLESVIWNAENCTMAGNQVSTILWNCTNLKTVTFGANVKMIPAYAFYYCRGLTDMEIPDSVTSIGGYAFGYCSGLTGITIPDSVTLIGENAFYKCSGLTNVTIGSGVTSIGRYVFSGCNGLTSVVIPGSVTSIGYQAFYGCSGLQTVSYKGTADGWGNILIGDYNTDLTSATRYYFSAEAPSAEQWASWEYWWHYDPSTSLPAPWQKG